MNAPMEPVFRALADPTRRQLWDRLHADNGQALAELCDGLGMITFEIDPFGAIVRLTVTHEDLPDAEQAELAESGWSAVLSNHESLHETGHVLPETPWEMPTR